MAIPKDHLRALCMLFSTIRDEKEAELLLRGMLTPQELDSIAERWQIVLALAAGIPQRKIAEQLNVSISKITRGSRLLRSSTPSMRRFFKEHMDV